MVGVLAQDYNLDLIQRAEVKGLEDAPTGRVNGDPSLLFAVEFCHQLPEIGLVKFFRKSLLPALLYSYVHGLPIIIPLI